MRTSLVLALLLLSTGARAQNATFWVLGPKCDERQCQLGMAYEEAPKRDVAKALAAARMGISTGLIFEGGRRGVDIAALPRDSARPGQGLRARDSVWVLIGRADSLVRALDSGPQAAVAALLVFVTDSAVGRGTAKLVAVRALGWLGPEVAGGAIPALVRLLDKDEWSIRMVAAAALGWMGPAAAAGVPGLVRLLGATQEFARANAAEALGEIGPGAADAIPALETALQDSKGRVRNEVRKALQKIRGGP